MTHKVKDHLLSEYRDALEPALQSRKPFLEYAQDLWRPEEAPEAWTRYGYAGDYLTYGMALLAFRHESATIAFHQCERWANLCLEVAEPEESIPQFMAYYYLAASAWLQTGAVPMTTVKAIEAFARRGQTCTGINSLDALEYSFAHALTGDWEQALSTIRCAPKTPRTALSVHGHLNHVQALTWAYQRLAGGETSETRPEEFTRAIQDYLNGDGLLPHTIPWLYAYQAIFAPDTRPSDLLYLLRPGAVPA